MTTLALVHGAPGSGVTSVAAELAAVFGGSRVFVMTPDRLLPMSEVRAWGCVCVGVGACACACVCACVCG